MRVLPSSAGRRYRVNTKVPEMARRTIDITSSQAKVAVFLDGCFWHGCPEHATSPKSNVAWWREKLDKNTARDAETTAHLTELGWTVLRFWEQEVPGAIATRVLETVDGNVSSTTVNGRQS